MHKILIIEENQKIAGLIGKFLQKKGFEVDIVPDGVSAIRSFVAKSHELLIVNKELPLMQGDDLCGRIRADSQGKRTPIIMMSGSVKDPSSIGKLSNELALSGFLVKPFTSEALYTLITSALRPRIEKTTVQKSAEQPPQPIKGDLAKTPFEKVLLYLMKKKGTGILSVARGPAQRKFSFIAGAPVDLETSLENDDFGNYLARKDLINAVELREYAERRKQSGEDPRDLFIKTGCLTLRQFQEENWNFLHDCLIDCFSWTSGPLVFEWMPSFLKTFHPAAACMPALFYKGFKTHLSPSRINAFLAEKGNLYVDKTTGFFDYQNHILDESIGAELPELIHGLQTCYQVLDSADADDAATVLYTLDYLQVLSYSATPKKSELTAPFPIREKARKPRKVEPNKFEDLGGELRELTDELGGLGDLKGNRDTAMETPGLSALEEDLKKKWEELKDKNFYELFGLTQNKFSHDKLKKAYFELTRTYGPEKFFASSSETMGLAEELLSRVSNAYETLSNVVSKENYDELLSSREQVPSNEEDKQFYEKVQFQSGKALLEQGQCESAEMAFTNCINIDENKPEYHAYLALAIYNNPANRGEVAAVKRAKDLVNKSLKLGKLSVAYALKGTMLLDEGSLNFAEAEFSKALKLNPNNKTALKKMEFIKAKREGEKKGLFQRMFK